MISTMRGLLRAVLPVWVLFALAVGSLHAGVLMPDSGKHSYVAALSMEVLEDEIAALDVQAVSSPLYADRFQPVGAEIANYGFRRSAFWFRLTIDFRHARDRSWHLVETHPILDHISFFLPDGSGGWDKVTMGDTLPYSERTYAVREFVLPIPRQLVTAEEPTTIYVRVAGEGALNIDFRLVDEQALAERVSRQQWGYGLFFGALAVMFLYNLSLYWSTRERAQLYYIVWLGGFTLTFVAISGFGLQLLWSDFPEINGWFPLFTCIGLWGALQFTRSFLDIRRDNPRTDRAFQWVTTATVVVFLLALLLPRHWIYILGTVLPVFFALVMMLAGVLRLRQGYQPARLFVAGWAVLLVGVILLPLGNFGILPINTLTAYSPQFGAVLQVVLLSLALGDRMNALKSENIRIEHESHAKLEKMVDQLRALDADKLRFLHYLSHELNTPLNWMASARSVDHDAISPELRTIMTSVETGQQRMIDLVAIVLGYFDLASEAPGTCRTGPVAPMWLVDDLLREHAAGIAGKRLKVLNRVPADLVLQANEQRLRRVLGYFIDNAINFSDAGQEIVIEADTETYGTRGVITVRDQGRGIDQESLPRLFEPFFMVGSHHREGGFGLSLATAKLLAAHMSGDLRVRSEGRGHGAAFSVVLPMATAAGGAAVPAAAGPAQSPAA